ncbi:MAG: DUF4105 domain-containing protein [Gammaproteobacteria bacterium]|nr:DUF4105 domain-containing protein [Gammaproteobacteria bacterium]
MIEKAQQLRLASDPQWLKLLHYYPNMFGTGVTSQADDPRFFNAKDGKTNPQTELTETIRQFFSIVDKENPEQHPQCRFPARFRWLDSQLSFDKHQVPSLTCLKFKNWIKDIKPHRATLVFPAAYINNPSTMFGHTFIRIDPPGKNISPLTSYAISYAAASTEFTGPLFAIKSLAGGQAGYFSIQPYYEKVNEYSELENRDIWEYDLNLTPDEIHNMLAHLWELQQIRFDYYFLDENCSYQLLGLLDVARSDLNLIAQFPYDVIPIDTVRSILNAPNILGQVHYRPSSRSNLSYQLAKTSEQEHQLVHDLAFGRADTDDAVLNELTAERRAYVLSLAHEYLQYKYRRRIIPRTDSAPRSLSLLKARSEVDLTVPLPPAPQPETRPDQGHYSARMIYGIGRNSDHNYAELTWRPAYHDLLDNDEGHVSGAQINFLETQIRFDDKNHKLQLEQLTLIDIYSVTPHTRDFSALSWKFDTGFERVHLDNSQKRKLAYTLNTGAGRTWSISEKMRVFALAEGSALLHRRLDNNLALGAGPALGLLWQVQPGWKIWLNSHYQRYGINLHLTYIEHNLSQSFKIDKNSALRLELKRQGIEKHLQNDVMLNFHWYY